MTRDEVREQISEALEDPSEIHFTSHDTIDTVQDGYEFVSLITQCVERIGTLNLVGEKTYYDLSSTFSTYYRVFAIYNTLTKRWLTPTVLDTFKSYSYRWELQHGQPREFCILGCRHIAVYPKPASSTGSLLVLYKAVPATLAGTDTFEFPAALHNVLTYYGVADLHIQDLEFTKSEMYGKDFRELLERVIEFVNHRSLPDRIYSLTSCQSSQSLISSD